LIACKLEDSLRFFGVKDTLRDIVDKGTMTEVKITHFTGFIVRDIVSRLSTFTRLRYTAKLLEDLVVLELYVERVVPRFCSRF